MKTIKPIVETAHDGEDEGEYFDPMAEDGIRPICVCGFELIKEDDDIFRCTGGSHRYRMSEGEVTYDKFGMPLMKIPKSEEQNGKSKKSNKKN